MDEDEQNIKPTLANKTMLEPAEVESSESATVRREIGKGLEDLLKERKQQRGHMLLFACALAGSSFALLSLIAVAQGVMRIWSPNYEVIDGETFKYLIIGVFGQTISVIFVIVKALWDDGEYLKKM